MKVAAALSFEATFDSIECPLQFPSLSTPQQKHLNSQVQPNIQFSSKRKMQLHPQKRASPTPAEVAAAATTTTNTGIDRKILQSQSQPSSPSQSMISFGGECRKTATFFLPSSPGYSADKHLIPNKYTPNQVSVQHGNDHNLSNQPNQANLFEKITRTQSLIISPQQQLHNYHSQSTIKQRPLQQYPQQQQQLPLHYHQELPIKSKQLMPTKPTHTSQSFLPKSLSLPRLSAPDLNQLSRQSYAFDKNLTSLAEPPQIKYLLAPQQHSTPTDIIHPFQPSSLSTLAIAPVLPQQSVTLSLLPTSLKYSNCTTQNNTKPSKIHSAAAIESMESRDILSSETLDQSIDQNHQKQQQQQHQQQQQQQQQSEHLRTTQIDCSPSKLQLKRRPSLKSQSTQQQTLQASANPSKNPNPQTIVAKNRATPTISNHLQSIKISKLNNTEPTNAANKKQDLIQNQNKRLSSDIKSTSSQSKRNIHSTRNNQQQQEQQEQLQQQSHINILPLNVLNLSKAVASSKKPLSLQPHQSNELPHHPATFENNFSTTMTLTTTTTTNQNTAATPQAEIRIADFNSQDESNTNSNNKLMRRISTETNKVVRSQESSQKMSIPKQSNYQNPKRILQSQQDPQQNQQQQLFHSRTSETNISFDRKYSQQFSHPTFGDEQWAVSTKFTQNINNESSSKLRFMTSSTLKDLHHIPSPQLAVPISRQQQLQQYQQQQQQQQYINQAQNQYNQIKKHYRHPHSQDFGDQNLVNLTNHKKLKIDSLIKQNGQLQRGELHLKTLIDSGVAARRPFLSVHQNMFTNTNNDDPITVEVQSSTQLKAIHAGTDFTNNSQMSTSSALAKRLQLRNQMSLKEIQPMLLLQQSQLNARNIPASSVMALISPPQSNKVSQTSSKQFVFEGSGVPSFREAKTADSIHSQNSQSRVEGKFKSFLQRKPQENIVNKIFSQQMESFL